MTSSFRYRIVVLIHRQDSDSWDGGLAGRRDPARAQRPAMSGIWSVLQADTCWHAVLMSLILDHQQSRHAAMIVGIVPGRPHSGALAYALERALIDRAKIRVISVGLAAPNLNIPLDTVVEQGDPVDALMRGAFESDVLVMQSLAGPLTGVADVLMTKLRANASCVLIEVDGDGEIVRASGPTGWHYACPVDRPPLK